jgi:hypothetical protein
MARLSHNLKIGFSFEQETQAFTQDRMVVGEHDSNSKHNF